MHSELTQTTNTQATQERGEQSQGVAPFWLTDSSEKTCQGIPELAAHPTDKNPIRRVADYIFQKWVQCYFPSP